MKKSLTLIFTFLFILTTFAGCGKINQSTPEDAVNSLFYAVGSASGKNIVEVTEYNASSENAEYIDQIFNDMIFGESLEKSVKNIEYEIGTSEIKEDKGVISVKVKYPNLSKSFDDILPEILSLSLGFADVATDENGHYDQEEFNKKVTKSFNNAVEKNKNEIDEKTVLMKIQKFDGKWYVAPDRNVQNIITCNIMDSMNRLAAAKKSVDEIKGQSGD